jgi:hypothetical protein
VGWWIFPIVGAVIVLVVVANKLGWIDLSDKSRRGGSGGGGSRGAGMMGAVDEIFAPARHEAQLERDRQSHLPAPAPIPGDGDLGILDGNRVSISLDEFGRPVSVRAAADASERP